MPWEGHLRSGPQSGMQLFTRMLALYRTSVGCKRRRGAALCELSGRSRFGRGENQDGFYSHSSARNEVMEERKAESAIYIHYVGKETQTPIHK